MPSLKNRFKSKNGILSTIDWRITLPTAVVAVLASPFVIIYEVALLFLLALCAALVRDPRFRIFSWLLGIFMGVVPYFILLAIAVLI